MCDFVGPEFIVERTRKARKEHTCCACDEVVRRGERYVALSGCWDGNVESFKQCMRCHAIMQGLYGVVDHGDGVDIQLDCGADPLEPGEHPNLDELAFVTRAEMQATRPRGQ